VSDQARGIVFGGHRVFKFDLRQVSHFIAIAEAGTFRRAAEKTFTAQPALSVSIHRLEDSLGVKLFERGTRGVTLTPAGEAFLVEGRRTMLHAEQALQGARLAGLGEWGVVRLGFVGSAAYQLLPRSLPDFIRKYPNLKLELLEGETLSIVKMLREGRIDAGVIRTPVDDTDGLEIIDVEKDDLIAVLPATHQLANRESIELADLHDEAFVMFSKTLVPGLRAAVAQACRTAGFAPRVAQEATQALTVVGLVGSGMGVAVVPSVSSKFTSERVRFVRLTDEQCRGCLTVSLAMQKDGASIAATKLCSLIAESMST
jgi:DNA-binding transcriptional LysR family regulator